MKNWIEGKRKGRNVRLNDEKKKEKKILAQKEAPKKPKQQRLANK